MQQRRKRAAALAALVTALLAAGVGRGAAGAQASYGAAERRCGNATNKVQLTFDDAAAPERVNGLLDVLADKQVRAGFFILGPWANAHPDVMARIRRDGHWLGNHTASHADLTKLSDEQIRREIAGGVRSQLFRPPYGAVNARVRAVVNGAGYPVCLWDIDTLDWKGRSAAEMQATVFSGLRPGAVVLMHLHGRNTRDALPEMIDGIRARGFELDGAAPYTSATIDPASGTPLLLARDGELVGPDGPQPGDAGAVVANGDAVAVAGRPGAGGGAWIAGADGSVYAVRGAPDLGGDRAINAPLVAVSAAPSGGGYWTAASDGGVFAHGDAEFFGSAGDASLNQPIVALAASPTGRGYWLLGRDGSVFSFGDAGFFGSAADSGARDYVALAPRPQGDGYWLLRSDGGVRAFGAAADHGSFVSSDATGRAFLAIVADQDGAGYRLLANRPGDSYAFR